MGVIKTNLKILVLLILITIGVGALITLRRGPTEEQKEFGATFGIPRPDTLEAQHAAIYPVTKKIQQLQMEIEDKESRGEKDPYGDLRRACKLAEDAGVISPQEDSYPSACKDFRPDP